MRCACHDLFFRNPIFYEGLNITVRNGDKWMKVGIGDELLIKEAGENKVLFHGKVIGKAYLPFHLIPREWLEREHDPNCKKPCRLIQ